MVKILRFFRGYVVFSVRGSYPEKFINLLIYKGINVWGVKSRDGIVYFTTLAVNCKAIYRFSRKSNNKVSVESKYGLPFFLNRNKNRVGLPIGFACFLLIFKLLSLFIWNIDIYGFKNISYSNAKDTMKNIGVYEGVYNNFDSLVNVQNQALTEFDNVSWITFNVDGSKGEVNISEVTEKGDIQNDTPYNIKADIDAQIIRVDAYSGHAVVKMGDAVAKGNLLISGFVETELGGTRLDSAGGVVWAKTERNEKFSVPKSYNTTIYNSESKSRYSCRIFNLILPLKAECYDVNSRYFTFFSENKAKFRDQTASVSLIQENNYFYDSEFVKPDDALAEKLLNAEIVLNELFAYGDKKIISRNIENSADDKNYKCNIRYVCEEDIGVKSKIILDDNFSINNANEDFSDDQ